MNIFSKIFSALKGGANEMGEAIVDANAIRIFEQELRDARADLAKAKESEVSLVASRKQSEAKLAHITQQISEYENHARKALEQGNENLALETAGRVASLQNEHTRLQADIGGLQASCEKIRQQVSKTEREIQEMENHLAQVKATDSVQKAQESIHSNILAGSSSVTSAKESLERIKAKQAAFDARQAAAEELATQDDLDKQLADAGIKKNGVSAQDVLAKLRSE
ncbi:PspA/IM30 family protein [Bowmanella sp. JS7-9]|uniref:PspA/IM30 family protein n=1 Tax=Pseudobowmanella zhangzhouensis TaxID=1537679 RepID=A0ABW1XP63_9ALTE|nr:PspA/IM30 family protein [Bowmanella sp. JS7-9]TBX23719.1 phage-shock protein [Bowmanella sp. JS7-9]